MAFVQQVHGKHTHSVIVMRTRNYAGHTAIKADTADLLFIRDRVRARPRPTDNRGFALFM